MLGRAFLSSTLITLPLAFAFANWPAMRFRPMSRLRVHLSAAFLLTQKLGGVLLALCLAAYASNGAPGLGPSAASLEWVSRAWQTEDGLPQNTVNSIIQTRDGFLWVATNGGVARFDGTRFRNFGLKDGVKALQVLALAEDRDGAVWMGASGGLGRWQNGRIAWFGRTDGFPGGNDIISLTADRDGSLWIGTDKGLVHRRNGEFRLVDEASGLPRKQIRAIAQDTEGTVWVSVISVGVFRAKNGRFEREPSGESVPDGAYCLLAARDGEVWAGGNVGSAWLWKAGSWTRFRPEYGQPGGNIESLGLGPDGTVWAGFRAGGVSRFLGDRFSAVSNGSPISTLNVRALEVDNNGFVWAGTATGGLFRLAPRVVEYWGVDHGLAPTAVSSVAESSPGIWLVGTISKGLFRFDHGNFTPIRDAAILGEASVVYCTTNTSDGATWVAGEQLLSRFHPSEPSQVFKDPVISKDALRALCPDGDSVWIGSYYSSLLKADVAGVKVVAPQGTFPGGITSIVRESADVLWIGTSEGLHRWAGGQIKSWDTRDGLLTPNVRTLLRDPDGTLWLGTLGGGLARMKDGRFFHYTTDHGLVDDVISQVIADDFGAIWLGSNRGIMRIERSELDSLADGKTSELHPVLFGRNEGMLKEQCSGGFSPAAIKAQDGTLIFSTSAGVAAIDPRRLQSTPIRVPEARIEEVFVDQTARIPGETLEISPGTHHLEVRFTAPKLGGGEWLQFRYQLEGFDQDWIEAGRNRQATYDNLPPGEYVFRVGVVDRQRNVSESNATMTFRVLPFFWQTLWFRVGSIALLVVGSGAAAWWLLRQKLRRQLAQIESERRQHVDLAHASRVALLGELTASLAHELKQPLNAILSNAQAGARFLDREKPDIEEVQAILKDIASEDRRASEIINRLRAMMKKGEMQMEARDLNADVEQALQLIRTELMDRGVTVDIDLKTDLAPVQGDHIQLQQVMLNLVINGCDAMAENEPADRQLLIRTAEVESGMLRVSVTDRGAGIPTSVMGRIFEPFYSTKKSGLGMGLAICRAIVRAHGGELWAENNPERGATCHFTLRSTKEDAREDGREGRPAIHSMIDIGAGESAQG